MSSPNAWLIARGSNAACKAAIARLCFSEARHSLKQLASELSLTIGSSARAGDTR